VCVCCKEAARAISEFWRQVRLWCMKPPWGSSTPSVCIIVHVMFASGPFRAMSRMCTSRICSCASISCLFRAMLFQPDVNGTSTHFIVILCKFRYDPSPALRWSLLHHVIPCEKTQKQSRTRTAPTPMCTHLMYTFTVFDDRKGLLGTALTLLRLGYCSSAVLRLPCLYANAYSILYRLYV
jgi:hypothetical protein